LKGGPMTVRTKTSWLTERGPCASGFKKGAEVQKKRECCREAKRSRAGNGERGAERALPLGGAEYPLAEKPPKFT